MTRRPLVSIVSLTYNHEAYIAQCLESLIGQQTNFDFEILINDDASTDRTKDIIEQFRVRHPSIIKPVYQVENQFAKGKGFVGLHEGFAKAQGKYIAYCEGDDYWVDRYKLQKQVDFLETHSEYHVCAHDTEIKNDYDPKKNGLPFSSLIHNVLLKEKKTIYTLEDTFTGNIFHISSILFRNYPIKFPVWINKVSACDMVLFMLLAKEGNIYFMKDIMSVYRNNIKSVTSTRDEYSSHILFIRMSLNIVRLMNRYFERKYQKQMYEVISRYYIELTFLYLRKGNRSIKKAIKMANLSWMYDRGVSAKYLGIGLYNWSKLHIK